MKTDNLHIRIDPERKAEFRKRADEMGMSISDYFEHLMDEEPMTQLTRLLDHIFGCILCYNDVFLKLL